MKKQKIALTWGGSGWHIFPLVSLYNYLWEENKYDFLWIGQEWELEERISSKNNIPFHHIATGKIRRYFDIRNFYEPLKNLTGFFQWIYYIYRYNIDIIFSKWGFVSVPLCLAWWVMWKKIYIHESDNSVGLANKVVSKIATKIFYTFPPKKLNYKHVVTGQILNSQLLDGIWNVHVPSNSRLKVVVIAWSQGSTIMFENVLKIIPDLPLVDFEIILWEKNLHFKKKLNIFVNTIVHDFVDQKELGVIYKNADIALTRGSSTVLWELYSFWIHSIIIPITQAGGHQIHNAEFFQNHFESDILDENKNLSLEMFRKIKKYQHLRKKDLNLDGFFDALKIIKREMN